jgi:alanine dehydrogenase
MKIGVPKEIKTNENRVGLVPAGVHVLVGEGHAVTVETGAGLGSGFSDQMYITAGATIGASADATWAQADMIIKVKEPIAVEWPRMRPGLVMYTYFHFAADEPLTKAVMKSGAIAVAYETVQLPDGQLPLLTPMSEVAGRLAVQEGAKYNEKLFGGRGVLLGGVPGVPPAKVVIIGGGVVGINSAKMAAGLGANVTVLDTSLDRLRYLSEVLPANVNTVFSNRHNILDAVKDADLIIGAVLIPGKKAPHLITREDLKSIPDGCVIVDVAVDQGGCVETIKPTTHEDPTYFVEGVLHYAVANMPGAVPRTSTLALTNATLPYAVKLANHGWQEACRRDGALKLGLNIVNGKIVYGGVAEAFGLTATDVESVLQEGTATSKK